jgi:hypothetical protein
MRAKFDLKSIYWSINNKRNVIVNLIISVINYINRNQIIRWSMPQVKDFSIDSIIKNY